MPTLYFDSRVRFCPRGHDTHASGRYAINRRCRTCCLEDRRVGTERTVHVPYPWPLGAEFWSVECEECGRTGVAMPRGTYTCGFCIQVPRDEGRVAV